MDIAKQNSVRLVAIILAVGVLLLIPLIAMQFTNEVNWTLADFIIGGVLLLGVGLAIEFVLRKIKRAEYRIAICIGALVIFALVWAELAVGIFGTPFAGD